jgi:hypothetical protein
MALRLLETLYLNDRHNSLNRLLSGQPPVRSSQSGAPAVSNMHLRHGGLKKVSFVPPHRPRD